ncbi:dynein regulatory complex protein 10-like [Sabethes cyaneus]|uniref:dynein regulatory complex protein 10-like n=1 Tax=Sabethes cyaneus TaxID=53552 RepID=UPI00237E281A|nr:dynein regulatory complex protein 10-like [Sabethes cyaneus]
MSVASHKKRINSVLDELSRNLNLFFTVYYGIQNLKDNKRREILNNEISQLLSTDISELIDYLLKLSGLYQENKNTEKYQLILNAINNLRQIVPLEEEKLFQYNHRRADEEKFKWTSLILANKVKIRNLRQKIRSTQHAIDEIKLKLFVLNEKSSREIQDIIDRNEKELLDLKQLGDRQYRLLQDEETKKDLDLTRHQEYRNLLDSHSQKRKTITKLTVQLQLWIKQYDKFVGEPMKEVTDLEIELSQFVYWKQSAYDPQEERLNELKYNVDLLESDLIEEQVENFRNEHAARVIQRGWRRILQKRSDKKKNKKRKRGKGKKRSKFY